MSPRYSFVENERALGQDADSIGVAGKGSDEGLCEYFVEFGGVVGALELSGAGEGVLGVGGAREGGEGLVSDGCYFYH